jgi:hypothetical protein
VSAADRALRWAAGGTVVVLAGVAGAISYSHMAELARLHGEVGWRAHAFPVSVDGIEVVASLVLLAHRRAGTGRGGYRGAALAAGTAASVAANVAVGAADPVGRLVAGWPAVALLVAIKLLSGLLDAAPSPGVPGDPEPGPGGPGAGASGPGSPAPTVAAPGPPPEREGPGPRRSGGGGAFGPRSAGGRWESDHPAQSRGRLRAAGHRIRNDRLGSVLAAVDGEGGEARPLAGSAAAVRGGRVGGQHAGV